ncbi:hypothetical protein B0H16DRAFT_1813233 [Mycena metata]|uniref:Uncharacterized protein n=1 Tax=Mycena metata TaxID=1033252 RepID=A0AAD7MDY1_9AGAR|nr:hypothetical protein B0H16DRAFT_1813233 [Mycena metata]
MNFFAGGQAHIEIGRGWWSQPVPARIPSSLFRTATAGASVHRANMVPPSATASTSASTRGSYSFFGDGTPLPQTHFCANLIAARARRRMTESHASDIPTNAGQVELARAHRGEIESAVSDHHGLSEERDGGNGSDTQVPRNGLQLRYVSRPFCSASAGAIQRAAVLQGVNTAQIISPSRAEYVSRTVAVGGAGRHIPSASADQEHGVKGTARFESLTRNMRMPRKRANSIADERSSGGSLFKLRHVCIVRRKRAERHRSRRTIEFEQVMAALKLLPPTATNGYNSSCKFGLLRLEDNQSWRAVNQAASQTVIPPPIPELLLKNIGRGLLLLWFIRHKERKSSAAAARISGHAAIYVGDNGTGAAAYRPPPHKLLKELLQLLRNFNRLRAYNES